MSDDTERGALVGRIMPDAKGGKPLFQILRRHDARFRDEEIATIRPCGHPRFTLDEAWSKVFCSECNEPLQPFDVLLRWAEYWQRLELERQRAEYATVQLLRQEIRRDMRRACITPAERAEAETFISRYEYSDDVKAVETFQRDLSRKVSERRAAHRAERRKRA